MTGGPGALHHMAVVIPARNEELLLPACLRSVATAMERAGVPAVAVVVLDRCTDASAAVAHSCAADMALIVVEGSFPSVGAARDAGVLTARRRLSATPTSRVWIANTDADSTVPALWLERQRSLADSGLDLLLGTVEPGPPSPGQEVAHRVWFRQHQLVEGHPHVHGANLGVRLSEMERVGGFGDASVGEDVALAARVRSANNQWLATDTIRVVTSPRRHGRAPEGFAEYLRGLDASLGSATEDADPLDRAGVSG